LINPRARPCDEQAIRSARGTADCTARARRWVLVATILASVIAYIDESVVNVALPAIAEDLATSVAVIQWVINAYTLCLAAFLLVGGAAGDQLGRRGVFIVGIAVFAMASVWCGFSPNVTQLIIARAAQGIGAALLIPCSLAIIGASFPEAERGKAIGTWAGFSAIAAAVGPLLGGWIVDHFTWQAIFLVNPFLAMPAMWIAWRHVPESYDPEAPPGIDWLGSLLVFGGLGGLAFGLIALPDSGAQGASVAAPLTLGLLLLMAFIWHEGRTRSPMMPLALFRSRTFTGINLLTLLLYGALGGAFFLLPFDLIQVHGYSATLAGTVFLPFTVIMGVLSRWAGGLLDRLGARLPLIAGPTIAAAGLALFAWSGPATAYALAFLLPITIVGLGMAVTVAPLTTTVVNAVPGHQTGVASGINNAVASVATLLAIAIFGAVALGGFNRALDRHLQSAALPSAVRQTIERAHGNFVIEPSLTSGLSEDRTMAAALVKASLAEGIRLAMLLAAALALVGAVTAALTIPSSSPHRKDPADRSATTGRAIASAREPSSTNRRASARKMVTSAVMAEPLLPGGGRALRPRPLP
jgi:EmrB/QacA subfamily drug resistance transporter